MSLAQRIVQVRATVCQAAECAGRPADTVTIVAVTKTVERPAVDAAYALGLRHFGENRVQDARAKFASPLPADTTLHLIGQLQTNKARPAAGLFSLIESVDRPALIAALEAEAQRAERTLSVLLQVNIAREARKAGCAPDAAAALADLIVAAPHLALAGLMTIAPLVEVAEAVRPVFRELRRLRDRLRERTGLPLDILSMGMSNDYPVAISEGATQVRIGRAIFQD